MRRSLLVLPLCLAACAGVMMPVGAPQEVTLAGQVLRVRLSNGQSCEADLTRADWSRGAPTIAGQMEGCNGLSYVIRPEGPSHVDRPRPGSLGVYFAPYARVRLGDGTGHAWSYDFPTGGGRI